MARLISIAPHEALTFPGMRNGGISTMQVDAAGKLVGKPFTVHVRGPQIFLVSDPGYRLGQPVDGEQRVAFELPRGRCFLGWEIGPDEDVSDLVAWSPPKLEPPPKPSPAIQAEDLLDERGAPQITAPIAEGQGVAIEQPSPRPSDDVEELDPGDDDDLPRQPARKARGR
jgi:hypothetical protein